MYSECNWNYRAAEKDLTHYYRIRGKNENQMISFSFCGNIKRIFILKNDEDSIGLLCLQKKEIYLPFPQFTLTSLNLRGPRYEKGPNRFADDDTKVGPRENFVLSGRMKNAV